MNLTQIKAAIAVGLRVNWSNAGYFVGQHATSEDSYFIQFAANGYTVGLTYLDGVTLNGKEKDFFIGECVELRDFINGYTECMLWAGGDDGELEGLDPSQETRTRIESDCRTFVSENIVDLLEYAERRADCMPSPWCHAGHDFWLTRCGHGAGFWNRGLEELGDRLSESARVCGNLDPYIGDNGEVWL